MGSIDDYVALVNQYIDKDLTDGLPVIPPTRESVAAMIAASGHEPGYVLGPQPPFGKGPILVKDVAVNAVLAGCLPEYMPVLTTTIEAIMTQTPRWLATTAAVAPLTVINGPIRKQLNVNAGTNVFGSVGFRANMTIGRAMRLCFLNLYGARSGLYDRATMGTPHKIGWVIGEDEEDSPWGSLQSDRGLTDSDNSVTVMIAHHPIEVNHLDGRTPEQILGAMADALSIVVSFNTAYRKGAAAGEADVLADGTEREKFERKGLKAVLFLAGDHRHHIARAGWSKDDIRSYVRLHAGRRAGDFRALGYTGLKLVDEQAPDDTWVELFDSPDAIDIVCAGGMGAHSAVSRVRWSVTRAIPDPVGA